MSVSGKPNKNCKKSCYFLITWLNDNKLLIFIQKLNSSPLFTDKNELNKVNFSTGSQSLYLKIHFFHFGTFKKERIKGER